MDELTQMIDGVDWVRKIHLRHRPPYFGIPSLFIRTDAPTAANVFFLLRFAFEYASVPAAIVLESDIVISPDALEYFSWAFESVTASPALRERVFTVNGYFEKSVNGTGDAFSFTTKEYGFMVWGWLCPAFSWPRIRAGWTWFHNWDITLEQSVRQPSGRVSLSPTISRTRNVGMQGINFNIHDPAEMARWQNMFVPSNPIDYRGQTLRIVDDGLDL